VNPFTTPAQAIIDPGDMLTGGGERWWTVTVCTPPGWPRFERRVYQVKAFTEIQAGQYGLERFAEELDGRPQRQIWMG
jgi:hypothetical protein